jgi:hypothetical protein
MLFRRHSFPRSDAVFSPASSTPSSAEARHIDGERLMNAATERPDHPQSGEINRPQREALSPRQIGC